MVGTKVARKHTSTWRDVEPRPHLIPVGQGRSGYTMLWRLATRTVKGDRLLLGIAGAYSAFGLIGSECNGIFLLNETQGTVVLDEHAKVDSGFYGAAPSQLEEYRRLLLLSPDDFLQWARQHPRCRERSFLPAPRRTD